MADSVDPDTVCRIAVIRPNHRLGNNLLLTPLLGAIEDCLPGAEVEVVTGGGAAAERCSTNTGRSA
ncbi:MAG: hypothetical protein IT481_06025 [Gammaproteobacteria bacterium]|nr:hypothetical protein [Gammaproteobacteria bacterium]